MKNNKQNKSNRKSMKGRWGKVGAPPKATKFPRGAFTMESLFNMNQNQCELSLRTKVDIGVESGALIALKARKQKGGAVGRPKAIFILKENFDASKHELAPPKSTKTKVVKPQTVAVVEVAQPTVAPVAPEALAPVVETIVEAVVNQPVPVNEVISTEPAAAPAVVLAPVTAETLVEMLVS